MTKQAKAVAVETAPTIDPLVVQMLAVERSPADAGREAGVEVFEGLSANITAFVKQHMPQQAHTD